MNRQRGVKPFAVIPAKRRPLTFADILKRISPARRAGIHFVTYQTSLWIPGRAYNPNASIFVARPG